MEIVSQTGGKQGRAFLGHREAVGVSLVPLRGWVRRGTRGERSDCGQGRIMQGRILDVLLCI